MGETGNQADDRRLSVIRDVLPAQVPPRVASWLLDLALRDLRDRRRGVRPAYDVLATLDLLDRAAKLPLAVNGNDVMTTDKIITGDAPGVGMNAPASTTQQAAAAMGRSVRWVRWMLETGRLRGWKLGRSWCVPQSSIDEYLNGKVA